MRSSLVGWFWAVFLSMHVLEPEFSPLRAPGSAYVLGAYGAWMTTTYSALIAALLSAAFGVAVNVSRSAVTRIACAAFVLAGVGAVLAGLFPMDFPGRDRRWARRSRTLSALAIACIGTLAMLVLSVALLGFGGYAQRVLIGLLFAWMVTVGSHLVRSSTEALG